MTMQFNTGDEVVVYTPDEVMENIAPVGEEDFFAGKHALVIGNPWNSAHVIVGNRSDIRRWLIDALALVDGQVAATVDGGDTPAVAADQAFRVEVRFDHHGTAESARAAAQAAASSLGGEVTAVFDEQFEEL